MGIYLIPMPFFVDGETYLEGKDCTPETFFQRMKAGAEISTSQPAPEEITSLWDTLLKTHDAVLHFPMSSGLSGSCHTAKALAQEYGGRVLVVDDRRISVTLAQSIRNAQVLLAQGKTAAEGGAGRISRLRGGDDLPPPEHLLPHGRGRGGRGLCKTLVKGTQRFRHPRRDRCCILIKI